MKYKIKVNILISKNKLKSLQQYKVKCIYKTKLINK